MNPTARDARLVVRDLPEETLVYDLENDRAHCLSPVAAKVWRLCDGRRSVREVSQQLRALGEREANEDMVWTAVEKLGKSRLLVERVVRPGPAPDPARRRMMMRALRTAGMLPFIISIVAPSPSEAASVSCSQAKCTRNNSANCSGCLNAPCSDAPGKHCTRQGNECNCR